MGFIGPGGGVELAAFLDIRSKAGTQGDQTRVKRSHFLIQNVDFFWSLLTGKKGQQFDCIHEYGLYMYLHTYVRTYWIEKKVSVSDSFIFPFSSKEAQFCFCNFLLFSAQFPVFKPMFLHPKLIILFEP